MCGLVGFFKPSKLTLDQQKCFKNMLYADALRGHHSTGVFALESKTATQADQKYFGRVSKMAGSAHTCMTEKDSSIAAAINSKVGLLLGHNRYATMGAHTAQNAHPFEHGEVVLAHNGTLWDHSNIDPTYEFTVDSEAVCNAMSKVEPDNAKEVIGKLRGAFALSWFDYRDNTLNFVRNDERPLHIGIGPNYILWASERLMLEWCAERNNVTIDTIVELPVGELYKYELLNFNPAEPKVEKVELSTETDPYAGYGWGRARRSYGAGSYSSYTGGSSVTNFKSRADRMADEKGFKADQIVKAWMFDWDGRRWEGMTDCDEAITLTTYAAKDDTFSANAAGEYVKLKSFYTLKGKDGRDYLCACVYPEKCTKREFDQQHDTPERKVLTLLDGEEISKDEFSIQSAFGCVLCTGYIGDDDSHKCLSNQDGTGLFCPTCSGPYMQYQH